MGGMRQPSRIGLAFRAILSVVAPLDCVVCGAPAEPPGAWPLCEACADSILSGGHGDGGPEGRASVRCSVCGKPIVSERDVCTRCRGTAFGFDSAYPLFRYAGDVRAILLAYKSGGRRSLSGFLALSVAGALRAEYPGRVVVPVPPRPGKLRRKGWDQVEVLARVLERGHGITVRRLLARVDGLEQKALDLEGRAANLRGKIGLSRGVSGGAAVPEDPVLLDDVLTTGATLSECAFALKAAGSRRVDAVAIAAD